jgi:catechol 2,3-dioxygenase-like lactoylglutathione lyase family enzyme
VTMIDHVTLQVADVATSRAFYEPLLASLHSAVVLEEDGAVGFMGREPGSSGSFWLIPAERPADRELHLAFSAPDRAHVRAFHAAALEIGAEILNAPRLFPEYHPDYYGTFVRDPDGHNVEAVSHRHEAG